MREGLGNLLLPVHLLLAVDLGTRLEALALVEQDGADDDLVGTHDVLVVVWVGGAGLAEVAVDGVAYTRRHQYEHSEKFHGNGENVPESPL